MRLNEIHDNPGATKNRKRVGRGPGSGTGKTSGRGHKGQKSRAGAVINGFEGGQMPIHRRLPKRGFVNIFRKRYVEVNLGRIQTAIDAGKLDATKPVDLAALMASGIIGKPHDGVRILAKGEILAKNLEIHARGASKAAIAIIESGGGKIVIEAGKTNDAAKASDAGGDDAGKPAAEAKPDAGEAKAEDKTEDKAEAKADADADKGEEAGEAQAKADDKTNESKPDDGTKE